MNHFAMVTACGAVPFVPNEPEPVPGEMFH